MSKKKTNNELHIELLTKISDHVQATTIAVGNLDKKLDLHVQKTELELGRINEQDRIQNDLLDKHIEGVRTLKQLYELHNQMDEERFDRIEVNKKEDHERIEKLEAPRKWFKGSLKLFLTLGAIASAIAGFMKLYHII